MARAFINSFNAGELSPTLDARVDIDKYKNGCRILENAIPKVQGGVRSRAGMEYIGALKYDEKAVRLLPFSFDVTTSFVLEFGDGYIRFWSNGQQVQVASVAYEISSPYGIDDLFNIQFTQVNDIIYLVDGTHHPQKLTRLADDSWTIADVDWVWPAMQDENAATNTLGTQIVTDLIRQPSEEWPQRVGNLNALMSFASMADVVSTTTKVAKLDRWNGTAWVNLVTRTWTTTLPADYTHTVAAYPTGMSTLLAGGVARCDTFRITFSNTVTIGGAAAQCAAGNKVWLYTDAAFYPAFPSGTTWNYRMSSSIDCSLVQPMVSLTECTVPANALWRVRVKALAVIPSGQTIKVQKWNGSAFADHATITMVANKWVTYNGAVLGSDTRYRLKWSGSTSWTSAVLGNSFAMQEFPYITSGPFAGLYNFGATSPHEEPTHGILLLEKLVPTGTQDITLTLDGTTGNGVNMTASAALFSPSHVGSHWQIAHLRDPEDTGKAYLEANPTVATAATYYSVLGNGAMTTTAGQTTGFRVLGRWDFITYGSWIGNVSLQVLQADGTTWETIKTWGSGGATGDRNVISSGSADTEQVMRIKFVKTTAAAISNVRFILEPVDARVYGLAKITAYTSATAVVVTMLKDAWKTSATRTWSEGSWSAFRGYPRAITVDDQRIVYGGTEHEPLTIWGSVIGDFENFRRTTLEDSSYAFRIASAKGNSIVWMAHQTRFMVGTQGDEWLVEAGSGSSSGVVTPLSVKITLQTSYGSAYVQPVVASDTIMFVERGRKRIREFVYQYDRQAFAAPDLCLLADHILADTEVKQLAFASVPDPIVWMITEDNQLASMTFERDQSVVGWSRHITDGIVDSVCVIYGAEADEVWMATRRTIDGEEKRYMERHDPLRQSKLDSDDIASMIYMDCAIQVMQTASTAVSGLGHLEGKTVSILADGLVQPSKTVSGGAITLDTAAAHIVVGLPFTVRIQPVKIEIPLPDGTSQGRRFSAVQAMLRFHRTGAAQYADAATETFYDVPFRDPTRAATEAEPSYTGDKRIFLASRHRDSLDLTIRNTAPLPFALLAIAPIVEASGQ